MLEYDLEDDISQAPWMLEKIRSREDYAQNLYAALCNMRWQKLDAWSVLKEETWSCSWRMAGGLVAQFQGKGDYMNWYCSGMGGIKAVEDEDENALAEQFARRKYVPEGTVTDEIETDLKQLGWLKAPWPEDD